MLPGVIGNADSLEEESHSAGLLEHPQYTRPPVWEGREIPPVLLSGNHAAVGAWRRAEAEALTRARRPVNAGLRRGAVFPQITVRTGSSPAISV